MIPCAFWNPRVRFFRLALLPFPFRCRMVGGKTGLRESGDSRLSGTFRPYRPELLRRRGIGLAPPEPVPKETQEQPGVRCPALPGRRPREGPVLRRRNETPPSAAGRNGVERVARLDRFSGYCPCRQGWFFFRKQMAEDETYGEGRGCTERTLRFSPQARGLAGRKGMTVMAMETGMGTTEPRQASADRCAAQPRSFLESTE